MSEVLKVKSICMQCYYEKESSDNLPCAECIYGSNYTEKPIVEDTPIVVDTPTTPTEDIVNHPQHYTNHPSGIECIDIVKHYKFCIGNAIKYIWRAGLKGGEDKEIEDLEKAIWYINQHIQDLKQGE